MKFYLLNLVIICLEISMLLFFLGNIKASKQNLISVLNKKEYLKGK